MWADLYHRARALFRRAAVDNEMDEELPFHLAHQVEKNLAAGHGLQEAERRARLELGGLEQIQEECRQARGVTFVETALRDLRHAARGLRRNPGFTAVVVLSLGLGIGANTAIFTLIDAVMLRMLPVEKPQQLQLLARTRAGGTTPGFSYPEFAALREDRRIFTDLAAYAPARFNVSVDGRSEATAPGQLVSGSYFSVLGVRPIVGSAIDREDDRIPDGHPVAMISDSYWKRRFDRAGGTIGRTISLGGRPFTIIGVTPPGFFGVEVGEAPDIFVPMMMQPTVMPASENLLVHPILYATWLRVVGRLRPGVSAAQVSALDAIVEPITTARARKLPPDLRAQASDRLTVLPAATGFSELRARFAEPLFILMVMVAVVLLISCANVANLLLARAAARRPELTMRMALGAGRWRLVQQLLIESLLLSALGGLCGVFFAAWASRLLVAFMSAGRGPIVLGLAVDLRVLGFTAAVSVATGILFGLAPAWWASRADLGVALRTQAQPQLVGQGRMRAGKVLVVSQVALCVLLLFAAGLFVRTLQNLDARAAGVPRDSVLVVRVEPRGSDQRNIPGTSDRLDRSYRDLLARVRALPNVRAASLGAGTPTSAVGFSTALEVPGGNPLTVGALMVYPQYFETVGLRLLAGRDFEERDLHADSPRVVVVNESLARKLSPDENPAGKRILAAQRREMVPVEIIGVVEDARLNHLRGEPAPLAYQPFLQTNTGRGQMVLHVRAGGTLAAVMSGIRHEVQRMDPTLPLFEVRTLAQELDGVLVRERLIASLSSFFGALALVLACVGLYGILAFAVVQRTGEMGVRMALGAGRGNVVWIVMREALVLVAIGVVVGVPAALALARVAAAWMEGVLFGLGAGDPGTIAAAVLMMAAAGALAAYLPARRAARVDPMVALRSE